MTSIILDIATIALTTATVASTGTFLAQADANGLFDAINTHGFTLVFAGVSLGLLVLSFKLGANYFLTEHKRIIEKLNLSEKSSEEKDAAMRELLAGVVTEATVAIRESSDAKKELSSALTRFCESRPCLLDREQK